MRIKVLISLLIFASVGAAETAAYEYRLLATSKTSTMEKEMNDAASSGFRFGGVMGGETGFGGKEVVIAMVKASGGENGRTQYRLLATNKTSTMEKELQQAGGDGYQYKGQTVFETAFGGREVAIILERSEGDSSPWSYRLLATNKTSTMDKELQQAGQDGYLLKGLSVGKTALGGSEVVAILARRAE